MVGMRVKAMLMCLGLSLTFLSHDLNNKLWNKRRGQGQISKELKSLYTPTAWESANHAKTGERRGGCDR